MNKFVKAILGVTLLEIMLVLAVAAMIIVMSVRYYQSASSSQQANAVLQQIQGITAAADGLAQATGAYTATMISTSSLGPLLPGGATSGFTTPWGTTITPTFISATQYSVDLGVTPSGVCPLLKSKLVVNNHYATTSSCGTSAADFSYTYTSNP